MLKQMAQNETANQAESSFDDLMANLLLLVSHQTLAPCSLSLPSIVERLQELCAHSELEHYPRQMRVLIKMQQFWETKLFNLRLESTRH